MTKAIVKKKDDKIGELIKIFDGDINLALFYVTWIKNGLKAGKAYKELHPEVDEHSANTMGSRLLKKVDKSAVMEAFGLDHELYFEQLRDGVKATKWNDFTGEREADHKTRVNYHDKLGKLLGIETDASRVNLTQVNMKLEYLDHESKPIKVAKPDITRQS